MARKKVTKKTNSARNQPYQVRVCRLSALAAVVTITALVTSAAASVLYIPEVIPWATIGTIFLVGIVLLLIGLAWFPRFGKTVIEMTDLELTVGVERVRWQEIASLELHRPHEQADYILLTLTNRETIRIDDGHFTTGLANIHRQLKRRV